MACNSCGSCSCNNINCTCNNVDNSGASYGRNGELGGNKIIISSHMICNNSARAAFFKNGGCGIIPKGYVPSVRGMLTSNGPKIIGCAWGNNPAPESEGMDCLNYKFNKFRHG